MLLFVPANDYIWNAGLPAMAINAVVISRSDPGAVPGASTISLLPRPAAGSPEESRRAQQEWGRNRIDEGLKDFAFARHDTTVIGSYRIVANDNYAEAALAA